MAERASVGSLLARGRESKTNENSGRHNPANSPALPPVNTCFMHLRTALLLLTLTALVPISSEENFRSNSGLSTGEKGELGEDVCNALSTGDNERRRCLLATSSLQGKRCCFLTLIVFS